MAGAIDTEPLDAIVDRLLAVDERVRGGHWEDQTSEVISELRSMARRISDPVVASWLRDVTSMLMARAP